jgi:hypothetical protein
MPTHGDGPHPQQRRDISGIALLEFAQDDHRTPPGR